MIREVSATGSPPALRDLPLAFPDPLGLTCAASSAPTAQSESRKDRSTGTKPIAQEARPAIRRTTLSLTRGRDMASSISSLSVRTNSSASTALTV